MSNSEKDIDAILLRRNVAIGSIGLLLTLGTILFHYLERWSWIDSFYFIVTTSSTVGYGDVTPQTSLGRLVAALFILIIVPIALYSFTTIAEISFEKRVQARTKIELEKAR